MNMKLKSVLTALGLCTGIAAAIYVQQGNPAHAKQPDYTVGDRLPAAKQAPAKEGFREIDWDALVPKNWDPMKEMKGLNLDQMNDADPRAMEALERMKKIWNDAPVESALNGARIRIPGFVVPLDAQRKQLKEFLLVPYFGACIHTPPPPANQIIHGVAVKQLKETEMMSAVWVSGTLETVRSNTEFGASGYRLKAELITPYTQSPAQEKR
jgi:hypothetical protein